MLHIVSVDQIETKLGSIVQIGRNLKWCYWTVSFQRCCKIVICQTFFMVVENLIQIFNERYWFLSIFNNYLRIDKSYGNLSSKNIFISLVEYYFIHKNCEALNILWKENLNSDDQQFSPISTKQTITSHLKSLNIKTTTYRNPGPDFGQALKCGRVKLITGIPTLPLLIIGSLEYKKDHEYK